MSTRGNNGKNRSTAYLEPCHVAKGQRFNIHHKAYLNHDDYACKPHFHNVHELIFFEQVEGEFQHPDGRSALLSSDVVFTPAMESHHFSLTTHTKAWYVLQFESELLPSVAKQQNTPLLKASHLRLSEADSLQVYQCLQWLLASFISAPNNCETSTLCEHILALTFSRGLRQQAANTSVTSKTERLQPFLSKLKGNELVNMSLDDAAALCFMSPAHFSRQFKRCTAMTYTDYMVAHKLKQAGRMLTQTTQSVTDISFALGFSSPSYFIRQFRRHFTITPKQFRQFKHHQPANEHCE